jgi:hypothetical protein
MHRVDQYWQSDEKKFIGKCQIQNVQICYSFHFAEAERKINEKKGKLQELMIRIEGKR